MEINDELLQDAAAVLGTHAVSETLNRALEEVREAAIGRTLAAQAQRRTGSARVTPTKRGLFHR